MIRIINRIKEHCMLKEMRSIFKEMSEIKELMNIVTLCIEESTNDSIRQQRVKDLEILQRNYDNLRIKLDELVSH